MGQEARLTSAAKYTFISHIHHFYDFKRTTFKVLHYLLRKGWSTYTQASQIPQESEESVCRGRGSKSATQSLGPHCCRGQEGFKKNLPEVTAMNLGNL